MLRIAREKKPSTKKICNLEMYSGLGTTNKHEPLSKICKSNGKFLAIARLECQLTIWSAELPSTNQRNTIFYSAVCFFFGVFIFSFYPIQYDNEHKFSSCVQNRIALDRIYWK